MIEINKSRLADQFNLEPIDISKESGDQNICSSPSQVRDPIEILYNNIDRANRLLDRFEAIMDNDPQSRQIEVAAKMIESITIAAEKIFTNQIEYDTLSLKTKMLDLKQRELDIREKIALLNNGSPKINQNILITDRESVLKAIREKKEEDKLLKEGEVKENDNGFGKLSANNSGTEGEKG